MTDYPVIFPLGAALLYSVAALFIRKASLAGLRPMVQMAITSLAAAAFIIPYELATKPAGFPDQWYLPAISAVGFFLGQLCAVLTLRYGDSSIQTPLMGTKVLIVAVMVSIVFGRSLPPQIWTAAVLATLGVAVLSFSRASARAAHGRAIVAALCSATFFAISDITIAEFAPHMPDHAFVAASFVMVSLLMVPYVLITWRVYPDAFSEIRSGGVWIALGTLFFVVQFALMIAVLSRFGDAPRFNVLYSSRGLWSAILLIVVNAAGAGHHMERAGGGVAVRRLVGAGLLTAAVALVL